MRFRVSLEFEIDRASAHVWVDDETGISSMEELVSLLFAEEDIKVEELEVEGLVCNNGD